METSDALCLEDAPRPWLDSLSGHYLATRSWEAIGKAIYGAGRSLHMTPREVSWLCGQPPNLPDQRRVLSGRQPVVAGGSGITECRTQH